RGMHGRSPVDPRGRRAGRSRGRVRLDGGARLSHARPARALHLRDRPGPRRRGPGVQLRARSRALHDARESGGARARPRHAADGGGQRPRARARQSTAHDRDRGRGQARHGGRCARHADRRLRRRAMDNNVVGALVGPNPFVGLTGRDVFRVIEWIGERVMAQPGAVMEQQAALVRELIGVLAARSTLAPEAGDRRFQDPTWSTSPLYRAWMQGDLAWRRSLHGLVDTIGLGATHTARAPFVLALLTEALAPTNSLLGNPAALKKALETGGASLGRGLVNLVRDVMTNGGMPAQVDKSAFEVGKNLAVSPGAVMFRSDVL